MDTYVYIDGFNLYYRAVRNTPYKWLDLKALCERIFPNNRVIRIKYLRLCNRPHPILGY